jgi:hypothetical protein
LSKSSFPRHRSAQLCFCRKVDFVDDQELASLWALSELFKIPNDLYRAESNPSTNSIGSRAVGRAIHDGTATVTRPGNQFFQKGIGLLNKSKASFKGLKKQKSTWTTELGKRQKRQTRTNTLFLSPEE